MNAKVLRAFTNVRRCASFHFTSANQQVTMPKNKVYEHDYEWSGQENVAKGVNINEKNPWNKPEWGTKPKKDHSGPQSSYDTQPDRFGTMEELQRRHQWEKPDWATIQKKASNSTVSTEENKNIMKDPIPKPMLKKTAAGVASGIQGASSTTPSSNGAQSKNQSAEETEREIAEMERRIEEARQKKAALEQQKLLEEAEAEAARQKHTVEESKLERARRLAKEREDARWRATLAERIQREKEQREQARLAALNKSCAPKPSDAVWEKTQQEQQQQYEERVRQEARKRQELIEQEMTIAKQLQQQGQEEIMEKQRMAAIEVQVPDDPNRQEEEIVEEIIEEYEEYIEEYVEEGVEEYAEEDINNVSIEGNTSSSNVDDIQRQIDALRKQLEKV